MAIAFQLGQREDPGRKVSDSSARQLAVSLGGFRKGDFHEQNTLFCEKITFFGSLSCAK